MKNLIKGLVIALNESAEPRDEENLGREFSKADYVAYRSITDFDINKARIADIGNFEVITGYCPDLGPLVFLSYHDEDHSNGASRTMYDEVDSLELFNNIVNRLQTNDLYDIDFESLAEEFDLEIVGDPAEEYLWEY